MSQFRKEETSLVTTGNAAEISGSIEGLLYNEALELVGKLPNLCDTKDGYFILRKGRNVKRT